MLTALSIQNIVLIDWLDLEFQNGLSVLTGETGAGKSILLDSLGLVLGGRGDSGLVRAGAKAGTVSAEFLIDDDHPLHAVLEEQGLSDEGPVVRLRRQVGADGRGRAFVNDQPVGVALLKQLGDMLVEIHGQHGQQGLLNPATHRSLLDAFGGLDKQNAATTAAWQAHRDALARYEDAQARMEKAQADEDFLRHAVDELRALAPQHGEEEELAGSRALMMHGEQVSAELNEALSSVAADKGAEAKLRAALRRLERVAEKAGDRLDDAIEALGRAYTETEEAARVLQQTTRALEFDPQALESTEERLFALRAAARKHNCTVEDLPTVSAKMSEELEALDSGGKELVVLERQVRETEEAFVKAARALSAERQKAADQLDHAVGAELPPLKLDKAVFKTVVAELPRDRWSSFGADEVRFEVATNPGAPMGPLNKIASGGELARFALALKVVLAQSDAMPTMVFDEIDQGVGGAVAAAVGDRLARLSAQAQILVVTHAPQVAARGRQHFVVGKLLEGDATLTRVHEVTDEGRREEVARMLAGAEVTDEARAAADRLLDGVEG